MTDEVRKIIQPIVRQEYSKELDAMRKERDETAQKMNKAKQDVNKAKQELSNAKQELSNAKQIISDLITASSNHSMDSSILAKAQAFLAAMD